MTDITTGSRVLHLGRPAVVLNVDAFRDAPLAVIRHLELDGGDDVSVRAEDLTPACAAAMVGELQDQLHALLEKFHPILDSYLLEDGLKAEDSQRICLLNALNDLSSAINGISESDLKLVPVTPQNPVRFRFIPEAVVSDQFTEVDAPDGCAPAEWTVDADELVRCGLDPDETDSAAFDDVRFMGDSPFWIRAWSGPFTIYRLDEDEAPIHD